VRKLEGHTNWVTTATFTYSFSGGIERGATLAEIKRNATTLGMAKGRKHLPFQDTAQRGHR